MRCYGLPDHFLSIKEFGGLSFSMDEDIDNWFEFDTYSFGLIMSPDSSREQSSKYIEIPWNSHDIKTLELSIKLNKQKVESAIGEYKSTENVNETPDITLCETDTWKFCVEFDTSSGFEYGRFYFKFKNFCR